MVDPFLGVCFLFVSIMACLYVYVRMTNVLVSVLFVEHNSSLAPASLHHLTIAIECAMSVYVYMTNNDVLVAPGSFHRLMMR